MRYDSEPILTIEKLIKYFSTRRAPLGGGPVTVRAVDGVSFFINKGEAFGLVGESGCGKTTVGRAVLRLVDPDSGSIVFDGKDISEVPQKELRPLRPRMQIIFQDPYSSLNPKQRIGSLLAEPQKVHGGKSPTEISKRVSSLLEEVGLPAEAAARYAHEFSGGQRQRIAIARALSVDPDFIVADEPVSALDVSIQAQILELLRSLMERRGLSFLFISHDLGVIRSFCQRLAVMYLGRIVETGPVGPVFDDPRHPYTRALRAASPVPDPAARQKLLQLEGEIPSASAPPSGCHFHPRCPFAAEPCKTRFPNWIELENDRSVACHLHDPAEAKNMKNSIEKFNNRSKSS